LVNKSQSALICLVVAEKTYQSMLERIDHDRHLIDLVEIRADFLEPKELGNISKLPAAAGVPLIFTIRRECEGGKWTASEDERRAILLRAAAAGFRYLDLESDVDFSDVEERCREGETTIIRSLHDFAGVPAKLSDVVRRLPHHPGEIPKVAVAPASTSDLVSIVEACRELKGIEKIILGMGPWGFPTRILAGKLGSLLTFCSPAGKETAPGHIDPETLSTIYRFKTISPSTDVYCVIGNPVMHSRSPWIHNAGFESAGLDAVYIPVRIDEPGLFFDLIPLLNIRGASVTIPHKTAIRSYLTGEDESVSAVGSCNTVLPTVGGFQGANTDVAAFIAPLLDLVGGRDEVGRMSATVVGAGGAARAAIYALKSLGAAVCIVNRTGEKAKAMAGEFDCAWAPLAVESIPVIRRHGDLIVQTTSVGMHPAAGADPLSFYDFDGNEIVYDVVYTPPETRLLKRAKEAGCRTLNGERMLQEQAYLQFKLFSGFDYPEDCRMSLV
jgi:3-dehydroquinate dehydratase / shikimate dehydrogenase